MNWQEQLESLLAESVEEARQREGRAFDEVSGSPPAHLVLYGAGNLGRKTLRGLRQHNVEPIAFADANPALNGKQVEGLPVYSPAEAVRKFGTDATFVVCVWHPDREHGVQDIIDRLSEMGAKRVTSFVPLFWKYAETFLPYYLWDLPSRMLEASPSIRRACLLLEEESRAQFVAQVRFRSRGDFSCLPPPSPGPAYFPKELFNLSRDECFVDCGAFDGDTIRDFVQVSGGEFRQIVAFEPDPANFLALRSSVDGNELLKPRTVLHQAAIGASVQKVRLSATGGPDASITNEGGVEVICETLDHALAAEPPSFIKMDIEGFEPDALSGAKRTIERGNPLLAICAYHRQNHLWGIPLTLHEVQPESFLALRMYWRDGFDLVCFSVPPGRTAGSRN